MFDILYTINMKTNTITKIGMREFLRNIKVIKEKVAKGQSFEVLERTKPMFRIVPIPSHSTQRYELADLAQFKFKGAKYTSQEVDTVVYGK